MSLKETGKVFWFANLKSIKTIMLWIIATFKFKISNNWIAYIHLSVCLLGHGPKSTWATDYYFHIVTESCSFFSHEFISVYSKVVAATIFSPCKVSVAVCLINWEYLMLSTINCNCNCSWARDMKEAFDLSCRSAPQISFLTSFLMIQNVCQEAFICMVLKPDWKINLHYLFHIH